MRAGPPLLSLLLCAAMARAVPAQGPHPDSALRDSVTLPAGEHLASGPIRRFFFGKSYRDLWRAPITVPVLDLGRYAGGLRPLRDGGGKQTRTLYLDSPRGQFAFRSVGKDGEWGIPARFRNTIVSGLSRDQVSTSHPAASLIVAPLLEAAGVPHATPELAVMPDDPALGEFRETFAGRLGAIEEFPADAITTDSVLQRLNSGESVNARAWLTARLMDMLISDWDRHSGNWRWFRRGGRGAWQPFPRDRDKAFASYSGVIAHLARFVAPTLRPLRPAYPPIGALTFNSAPMDRRLLAGVERSVYDSIAAALQSRLTDEVINAAVYATPAEYHATAPELITVLRARRDHLPDQARVFYAHLAGIVDVHATTRDDRATVTRLPDGAVEIRVVTDGQTFLARRFDPAETREIRLYLHEGDDQATITGDAPSSIMVRVIGGNGSNSLSDQSRVGGRANATRLYDAGQVERVSYGADTLFDRRPWVRESGEWVPPKRDRGMQWKPVIGFGIDHDLGFTPRFGISRDRYAFGHYPYAGRVTLDAEYATTVEGWRVNFQADRRREHSPLHFALGARMSELELIAFYGFGNQTPDSSLAPWHAVDQRQWTLTPAVAWSLGPRSNLFFGPVVQYTVTDSVPGTLLASQNPYGLGEFGQAGLRLSLYHDVRNQPRVATSGMLIDATASWFPGVWDATAGFATVEARAHFYYTLRIPLKPIVALRTGGRKAFGTFPFHEAAFIGGRRSAPNLDAQRYAGDAALFGTAELRVPIARFSFLLPLDIGLFGSVDEARVFVDGDSPGGWHQEYGAGFWIGILDPSAAISVTPLGGRSRTGVLIRTGFNF